MPLDPNIALQVKPIEIASPVDMQTKALTLKSLGQQSQMQDQQFQDQQSLRDAFKQNLNLDGSINKTGVVNSLAANGQGKQAMDYSKMFQDQDLQKLKTQSEVGKTLSASVYDEPTYQAARAQMAKFDPAKAAQMPQNYDPTFVDNWKMHSIEGDKQLELAMKQQGLNYEGQKVAIEGKKADAMIDRNNVQRETNATNKQNTNLNQVQGMLESARGNPEVSQALKDRYAVTKFNTGYNLYGDPNKLNPQQSNLLVTEAAKIASGGVPTVDEQRGLQQSTVPKFLAEAAQALTNDKSPAQQGAFLKALKDYNDGIAKDANKVIDDKWGRVIRSRRNSIGEDNYKTLMDQYLPQDGKTAASAVQKPLEHMTDSELEKAYRDAGGQ